MTRNRVPHQVRTDNRTYPYRVGVRLVQSRADGRSEVRAGLDQRYRIQAPSAQYSVRHPGLAGPTAALPEGQFVSTG